MTVSARAFILAGVIAAAPAFVFAESNAGTSDFDRINIMLEFNQRMVEKTEAYLKDRAQIPEDYQAVADKEYLRRAAMEKPVRSAADLPVHKTRASSSAAPTMASTERATAESAEKEARVAKDVKDEAPVHTPASSKKKTTTAAKSKAH